MLLKCLCTHFLFKQKWRERHLFVTYSSGSGNRTHPPSCKAVYRLPSFGVMVWSDSWECQTWHRTQLGPFTLSSVRNEWMLYSLLVIVVKHRSGGAGQTQEERRKLIGQWEHLSSIVWKIIEVSVAVSFLHSVLKGCLFWIQGSSLGVD